MKMLNRCTTLLLIFLAFALTGCATQVTEQPSPVKASSKRLGEFNRVILLKTEIAPTYAGQGPNIKAVNKIDEHLAQRLPMSLQNVEVKTKSEYEALNLRNNANVLVIKPYVKQIKFIGGAARFWAGPMAGSSVVIMDVAFEQANGTQLSNPGFMRKAGAYTDGFGVGSNVMLSDVVDDVINYVNANR